MPFASAWNEARPEGNRDRNLGDDDIREFKVQFRERFGVDHHISATDDTETGYHEKATFLGQASDPSQVADALILFAKEVAGVKELYSRHETAAAQQLTLNGDLWLSALGIASQAQGDVAFFDSSIWNRLAAGIAGQFLKTGGAGANPAWGTIALKSQTGNFTRNISLASGTQAITGVSFTPDIIMILSCVDGTPAVCVGLAIRASGGNFVIYNKHDATANAWGLNTGQGVVLQQAAGAAYAGSVSSFDVDGFTMTWVKSGAPSGTGTMMYLAFALSV